MLSTRHLLAILAATLAAAAPPLPLITTTTTTSSLGKTNPVSPELPTPTPIVDCSYEYCDGQTSWCFYWGGITGYDVSLGPLPGEIRTSIGLCGSAVSAWFEAEPTAD